MKGGTCADADVGDLGVSGTGDDAVVADS